MLELAVRAGLPLIAARTTDLTNFPKLLAHLTGKSGGRIEVGRIDRNAIKYHAENGKLIWTSNKVKSENLDNLLQGVAALDCTLVCLNQEEEIASQMFNAGQVPVPPAFIRGGLVDMGLEDDQVEEIMPGTGGLTLKEVHELVKLCQARDGALTLPGVLGIRQTAFSSLRGLQVVDTALPYYFEDVKLEQYLSWAGRYLLGGHDQRLRPRGLLLAGPPGTGKTTAAKRAAQVVGVPLFKLDLGAVKGRFVGESEHALSDALAQVEREAPCVLLLDEVEKLFAQNHDDGTTQNLLACTLWWLSEHRDRVLTIMTTNAQAAIPRELTRHGRLDGVLMLDGLVDVDAESFAHGLAESFIEVDDQASDVLCEAIGKLFTYGAAKEAGIDPKDLQRVPQAQLAEMVKQVVRAILDG